SAHHGPSCQHVLGAARGRVAFPHDPPPVGRAEHDRSREAKMGRIAGRGAGSRGTAVGKVLADAGSEEVRRAWRSESAAAIKYDSSHGKYLPGSALPANVTASTDPAEALSGADEVVLAVPSQSLRGNLEQWVELVDEGAGVISLAKGI